MANSRGERKTEHFDAACMKHGRCSKYDGETLHSFDLTKRAILQIAFSKKILWNFLKIMNEDTGRRQFPFAIWNRTRHNWKERKAYR
ncbi:hypothetical protein T4E_3660 [Trichinella pseudospiralis]|uniref:Uncharacterized protein n=1 Tax=Trichinella pseudospiralis TaxID=6337 RepID=A0A0V0XZX0_TRIPS|nr:hypothetical protein T4E_3660 [Trichinella pseudospiralis]